MNPGIHRNAGTAAKHAAPIGAANANMLPSLADALYRRRIAQYRKVEFDTLRQRYAQLHRRGHRFGRPRGDLHLLEPFLRQQYWTAALAADGAALSVDLSELASDDDSVAAPEATNDSFPNSATPPGASADGSSSGGDNALVASHTGTLTLSGGSIHDTDKMTVDAAGTVPLFSSPDWAFNAKFDDKFAPDDNKVNAGGILQLFATPHWSFTAKFDGEFSPQPQLYAGSGMLRHTW